MNRECGSCTACCEGWLRSPVTKMRAGKPCRHCTVQGCAIYEERPIDPCVNFSCGWLAKDSLLPEEMRPDRCGAIVLFDRPWKQWKVIAAFPCGPRIPRETLERLMACAREHHIPLLFHEHVMVNGEYTDLKRTGYGPPAFAQAARDHVGPDDIFRI